MNGRIIKFEGSAHAEVDRLLPWWINGSLDGDERAQVEHHLAECVSCQQEVTWLRGLQHAYDAKDVATDDATPALRRLRRRVAHEHKAATGSPYSIADWWRRHRPMGWVVVAQAMFILVLGGAWLQQRVPTYHTLSAPAAKASLMVVTFAPQTSEARLRELLRANHARLVGGPSQTGAYLLSVPDENAVSARQQLHEAKEVTLVENLDAGSMP
jgi:hypothetical protein